MIGRDDPTLTPAAGLALVAEVDRILGVVSTIDDWVGRIKDRDRGLSAGELVVSMAECMLAGGDFMCDLDNLARADVAGAALRAVPGAPASTTFIALARRFDDARIGDLESAVGAMAARWFAALPAARRRQLAEVRPTVDLDPTDIEVYGSSKQGVAWNYAGQRCGRAHPAVWAEAGIVVAGELGSGTDDPRPQALGLIARALAALPEGLGRPRVRADSGFFDRKVAAAALAGGADFAIAAKRNTAVWRSAAKLEDDAWTPAAGMAGAEVASCDYVPGGWPEGTRTIVRRVRVEPDEVRRDPRSRRRRTIDPTQLALVLGGGADHAFAYSFIVTNLDGDALDIEAWFRGRAQVEERLRDSKCGLALRHLPSGYSQVNAVWMWSAFLALNLSVYCQSLAGVDTDGRAHAKRARRELFNIPARVLHHARRIVLRLSPVHQRGSFLTAWSTLRSLPTAAP
ncbi:MAG TPA: IS1380 family transposase [Acidimicrobiales bacterium]|nr:IS1380 family transposase [Acidimicrobiales bacterium]